MDHYVEIRLQPDPEFPVHQLMNDLFAKLRAGNKIMSDAELEACMTQVLALFRFMHDKDMF